MKRGVDERGPIAAWLIRSREAFRAPGADRSWTVDDFLAALASENGKAPARTTYARWESGAARPQPSSLRPIVAFYAARGIAGPDAAPASETPASDPVAAAIDRQTAVLAQLVAMLTEWRADARGQASATADALGLIAGSLGAFGPSAAAAEQPRAAQASSRPGR